MPESLLTDDIKTQVKDVFAQLQQPVHVLFFGKKDDCDYCPDMEQLITEVAELSDKITLASHEIEADAELARQYNVDKAPALVLLAHEDDRLVDYGIRYAGIPSGHEFSSLIHDLLLVAGRDSGLKPETRQLLQKLDKPVHLLVFVTPT